MSLLQNSSYIISLVSQASDSCNDRCQRIQKSSRQISLVSGRVFLRAAARCSASLLVLTRCCAVETEYMLLDCIIHVATLIQIYAANQDNIWYQNGPPLQPNHKVTSTNRSQIQPQNAVLAQTETKVFYHIFSYLILIICGHNC